MTDHSQAPGGPASSGQQPPARRGRGRRFLFVTFIAIAAAFTGALATKAVSSAYGFGPRHWHGGGFMGGSPNPAWIEERADRMARHFGIEIDASAEQQDKLRALMKAAVRDLLPLREQAQAARRQARTLLTQATIDRAAIEKFRAEQMALADTASKRIAQALADAAEVLTPEQRRAVDDFLVEREGYRPRWGRH